MRNLKIAAAVAGVLGTAAAHAALPTQTQSATTSYTFYMGGSSAAASSFSTGVGADLCGGLGNLVVYVTLPSKQPSGSVSAVQTPDFRAFSCFAASGKPFSGNVVTVYYRADGGSAVGAYAALNNISINELDLGLADCVADAGNPQSGGYTQYDCATSQNPGGVTGQNTSNEVVGTTTTQGKADTYTGAVTKHVIEYGITDLEPGAFGNNKGEHWAGGGNDDPVAANYYTFLGTDATPDTLQKMTHTLLFQQSFGFVANTNLGISDISSAAVATILNGDTSDWSLIPTAAGTPVASSPTNIVVCHRDLGSGTRTSADIIFEGTGCNPFGTTAPLSDGGTVADNFSTPDELACVQANSNSIGYVSIDNFSKAGASPYGNVKALTLDGRTASNKLTATGGWPYVVEASANKNTNITFSNNQNTFYNYLIPAFQALSTAPQAADITVLPGFGGNSSNAGTLQSTSKIYVTSYMRDVNGKGNSCNPLSLQ